MTPVVLTVGTTHPLHVAGIGLDLRMAARLGIRVVTVVAGVSAQNAAAVLARAPVDSETIAAQFAALAGIAVGAVHVGALLDAESVAAVARGIAQLNAPAVCDPVLAITGGDPLAAPATLAALRDRLFPRCVLVTPNLDEAAALLGAERAVNAVQMHAQATALARLTGCAVLLKGGHLPADDDALDVLADGSTTQEFRAARLPGTVRGTGDLLACAVAARLAYGDDVRAAIAAARTFVRTALTDGEAFAGTRTVW